MSHHLRNTPETDDHYFKLLSIRRKYERELQMSNSLFSDISHTREKSQNTAHSLSKN